MVDRLSYHFSAIFSPIMRDLLRIESSKERVQAHANRSISHCRKSISLSHRKEFAESKRELAKAKSELANISRISHRMPQLLGWNLVISVYQEYVEASLLLCIGKGTRIPTAEGLAVPSVAYLLGVADLMGELRRRSVNAIRSGDIAVAEESFQYMIVIFEQLSRFPFSDAVAPGLRRKIDQARYILEESNSELAEEHSRRRLIGQMEDFRKLLAKA
jgi:translin